MNPASITPEYEEVAGWLRERVLPWRKMTIAIDGVDHAGKSSLARFLAWQLGMPAIEADFALDPEASLPKHDLRFLSRMIRHRHESDHPALVEGVFVLRALQDMEIIPDLVIGVQAKGRRGSLTWQYAFRKYRAQFPRARSPDYRFRWSPKDDA